MQRDSMHSTFSLTIPALMLGLSLSSCAVAQNETPRDAAKQASAAQGTTTSASTVELRVENGKIMVAKVNGKDVPADRIKKVRDGFEILDGNGGVVQHIAAEQPPDNMGGEGMVVMKSGRAMLVDGNAHAVVTQGRYGRGQDADVVILKSDRGDGQRPDQAQVERASPPKSMIGVGLGSPDDALAHHLAINRAKSTMVTSAMDGLPAQKAGMEKFDVIVSINGDKDASPQSIRRVLRDAEPGAKIRFEVRRATETKSFEVEAVPFDGSMLELVVAGVPLEGDFSFATDMNIELDEGDENTMVFVSSDGKKHEIRIPSMAGMQGGNGPGQFEEMQRAMGDFDRRMQDWGRQFDRRMDEQSRRMEDWGRQFDQRMSEPGRRALGEMNRDGGGQRSPDNRGAMPAPRDNEDRMRRLEERIEQLTRELEKARAQPKPDSDE